MRVCTATKWHKRSWNLAGSKGFGDTRVHTHLPSAGAPLRIKEQRSVGRCNSLLFILPRSASFPLERRKKWVSRQRGGRPPAGCRSRMWRRRAEKSESSAAGSLTFEGQKREQVEERGGTWLETRSERNANERKVLEMQSQGCWLVVMETIPGGHTDEKSNGSLNFRGRNILMNAIKKDKYSLKLCNCEWWQWHSGIWICTQPLHIQQKTNTHTHTHIKECVQLRGGSWSLKPHRSTHTHTF